MTQSDQPEPKRYSQRLFTFEDVPGVRTGEQLNGLQEAAIFLSHQIPNYRGMPDFVTAEQAKALYADLAWVAKVADALAKQLADRLYEVGILGQREV